MGGKKKNNVLVSGMSPVTRDSEGTVVAFPNVCGTPAPNGQAPVPYPSIARSEDLVKGSRSVTINGASVCLSTSKLSRSTGDEPGTGGGLLSGKRGGAAHPVNHDFSVRIEGKPVVRNMDLFTSNDRNTAPFPIIQAQEAPPVATNIVEPEVQKPPEEPCPYCDKPKHDFARKGIGNNIGASLILRSRILDGKEISSHPWYTGVFSLAAHHLICSEAMDSERWAERCQNFGYDINCRENGVMLPMQLDLACQLQVALHRGDHSAGLAHDLHLPYPDAVTKLLKRVADETERGTYCENPEALIKDLHAISLEILARIASFSWTITRDGLDYQSGGNGCAGARRLPDKSQAPCPHGRKHSLHHKVTGAPILTGARPLKIGE